MESFDFNTEITELNEILKKTKENSMKSKSWNTKEFENIKEFIDRIKNLFQEVSSKLTNHTNSILSTLKRDIVVMIASFDNFLINVYKTDIKNPYLSNAVTMAHNYLEYKYKNEFLSRLSETIPLFFSQDNEIDEIVKNFEESTLYEK